MPAPTLSARRTLAAIAAAGDWVWAPALIAAGTITAGLLAPTARADTADDYAATAYPAICDAIEARPFVSTVLEQVDMIAYDAGSYEVAGAVIAVVMRDYCPSIEDTVDRWIAVYTPTKTAVA